LGGLRAQTERARCIQAGAFVSQPTEPGLLDARLWRDPEMTEVGLTVSRSLGHHGARGVGMTPEPTVRELALSVADEFLIIGSDGLWTFIEPQEAVDICYEEFHATALSVRGYRGV